MDKMQENKRKNYGTVIIILSVVIVLSIIGIIVSIVKIVSGNTEKEIIPVNQVVFSEEEDDIVTNEEEAYNYIAKNADSIGIDDMSNVAYKDTKGSIDSDFYSFQQTYQGIPVYGSHITVMTDHEGNVLMTSADYLPVSNETDTSSTVTLSDVKKSIKKDLEKDYGFEDVKDIELENLTKEHLIIYLDETDESHLAYQFNIVFQDGESSYSYTVIADANSGDVLKAYSNIDAADASKTIKAKNLSGESVDINTYKDGKEYYLYDEERNILITDNKKNVSERAIEGSTGITTNPLEMVAIYKDPKPELISNTDNKTWDTSAVTVLNNISRIYDWYKKYLNLSGWDNKNGMIIAGYNDGVDLGKNAYSHTLYSMYNQLSAWTQLVFGYSENLERMDLIAHEYSHSVQQGILDMEYVGETGAIMEGYADTMGEIIEGDSEWYHGDKNNQKSSDRNIKNPSKTNNPSNYIIDVNWKETIDWGNLNDGGNRHQNSTVISHFSYLLSYGVDGTEERKLNNQQIALLWYQTLHMCDQNTTFIELRQNMEYMARILCNAGRLSDKQYECVGQAFDEVGIGAANADFVKKVNKECTIRIKDFFGYSLDSATVELMGEKKHKTYSYQTDEYGEIYISVEPDNYTVTIKDNNTGDEFTDLLQCQNVFGVHKLTIMTFFRKDIVRSFVLNETEKNISVNDTYALTATVYPVGIDGYNIVWESSDNDVATVNSDGIITAKTPGSTTITATLTNGEQESMVQNANIIVTETQRDTILVLDVSGSMQGEALEEMKKSAMQFCQEILIGNAGDNQIDVITYDSYIESTGFTNDYGYLENYIGNLSAGMRTDMQGALYRAKEDMDYDGRTNSKKNIVIMSDGIPNEGVTSDYGKIDNFCRNNNLWDGARVYGNAVCNIADEIMKDYNLYSLAFLHNLSGLDYEYCDLLMSLIQNSGYYIVDQAENLQLSFGEISNNVTDGSKIVINIACPVDVTVSDGEEVLSSKIENYNTEASFGRLELSGTNGDTKVLTLYENKNYDIDLSGNGSGTMNYTISYYGKDDSIEEQRNFENVPISANTQIDTSTEQGTDTILNIDKNGDGVKDEVWTAGANTTGSQTWKDTEGDTVFSEDSSTDREETNTNTVWIISLIGCSIVLISAGIFMIIIWVKLSKLRQKTKFLPEDKKENDGLKISENRKENRPKEEIRRQRVKINNTQVITRKVIQKSGKITFLSGAFIGATVEINPGDSVSIGKDPMQVSVVVPREYQKVSRVHCMITFDKDNQRMCITDYSTNGTYVNDSRIEKNMPIWIRGGSTVELSKDGFKFVVNEVQNEVVEHIK